MSVDPHPVSAPPEAPCARSRVHRAVAHVAAALGPDGVTPFIADGRFDRWVRGLIALDPLPGEVIAVRVDTPPRWVLAVLADLVGPTGRVWVVPARGRASLRWRWRCRGLGPAVRVARGLPDSLDGLWCLHDGCAEAGQLGATVRDGGRMVIRWRHGGPRAPWMRVEREPGRLTVDAAA